MGITEAVKREQPEITEVCTDDAIAWLLAVRAYGLDKANKMFPGGNE